ncbi:hypothetical protein Q7P37_002787 [Cladosporium fusiforme]
MRLTTKKTQLLALFALAGVAPVVKAQANDDDLPDLNDEDDEESTSSSARSTSASSSESSSRTTAASTSASTTESSSDTSTGSSSTGTFVATDSSSSRGDRPTDLPTIAGAGIPTMVVPYTANAPFMQHSSLPQGTVFIVVGAVLAFLGACVLFWRALVAWSINRSVKQAAIASVTGSEKASKNWGGSSTGYNPVKGGLYKDTGSSMSLEALNAAGKPLKSDNPRKQPPPEGLFFSPTAQHRMSDANLGSRPVSQVMGNRSSTYLPAGYYANSSAQAGGGAPASTIGGNLAPYARHSTYDSPPTTPGLNSSRHLRTGSREGMGSSRNSYLDASPRHGTGNDSNLPGSRAPSAYLEDLFDNHGSGPRERFS